MSGHLRGPQQARRRRRARGRSGRLGEPLRRDRTRSDDTGRTPSDGRTTGRQATGVPARHRPGRDQESDAEEARPEPPERENDVERGREPTGTESVLDTGSRRSRAPKDPKVEATQIEAEETANLDRWNERERGIGWRRRQERRRVGYPTERTERQGPSRGPPEARSRTGTDRLRTEDAGAADERNVSRTKRAERPAITNSSKTRRKRASTEVERSQGQAREDDGDQKSADGAGQRSIHVVKGPGILCGGLRESGQSSTSRS